MFQLDPKTTFATHRLAELLQRQKRRGEVIALWQRYLELVPGDTEAAEQLRLCAAE